MARTSAWAPPWPDSRCDGAPRRQALRRQPHVAVRLANVDNPRGRGLADVDTAAVRTEAVTVDRTLDGVADESRVHHEVVAMRAGGVGRHRLAPPRTPEQHDPRLPPMGQPPHQHGPGDIRTAGAAYPDHGAEATDAVRRWD